MLQLIIKGTKGDELWDAVNKKFVYTKDTKDQVLTLEHSLVSLSKWEFIWEKPFLDDEPKTREEMISYAKCMTINQNIPDEVYERMTNANFETINNYIAKQATATTFKQTGPSGPYKRTLTSDMIYYWMTSLRIPFIPSEKWHLNRLLTLIRICNDKNHPKKMSNKEIAKQNAAMNKARRDKMHSKG